MARHKQTGALKGVIKTLRDNVLALKGKSKLKDMKGTLPMVTRHRLTKGLNAQLSTLEELAHGYKLEAWQLLVDGFKPEQPPQLLTDELLLELTELREMDRQLAEWEERKRGRRIDAGDGNGDAAVRPHSRKGKAGPATGRTGSK